ISQWPVDHAAAAVITGDGRIAGSFGDVDARFPLASVPKPLTAYAVLLAYDEGAVDLDEPAGPEGSTVKHLLAHASGLDVNERRQRAAAGTRRIYSNAGFEVLADHVALAADIAFA